jgi:hypothetical protein
VVRKVLESSRGTGVTARFQVQRIQADPQAARESCAKGAFFSAGTADTISWAVNVGRPIEGLRRMFKNAERGAAFESLHPSINH